MDIKKILIFSIFVDIAVVILSFLLQDNIFLLNTQIAYLCVTFVIFTSYMTYKTSIMQSAKLYSDTGKKVSHKESKKIFRVKNLLSYISIYRLAGYATLTFTILYLMNNQLFNAIGYIAGVSITPFSIILYLAFSIMLKKKN